MSASLVGSEMCIRDSPFPLHTKPQPKETNPLDQNNTEKREDAAATEVDAVSYTHLTLPTICSV
eukprot:832802-Alexandrium_andersonii.AAC.1